MYLTETEKKEIQNAALTEGSIILNGIKVKFRRNKKGR